MQPWQKAAAESIRRGRDGGEQVRRNPRLITATIARLRA
jgi:hypothetical protein